MSIEQGPWPVEDPRLDAFRKLYGVLPDLYGPRSSLHTSFLNSVTQAEPFQMTRGSERIAYILKGDESGNPYEDTMVAFLSHQSGAPTWVVHFSRSYDGVTDGSNSENLRWEGPVENGLPQPSTRFSFIVAGKNFDMRYFVPTNAGENITNPAVIWEKDGGPSYLYDDAIQEGILTIANPGALPNRLFKQLAVPIQITPGIGITEPQ